MDSKSQGKKQVNIRMTEFQYRKLKQLGGQAWILNAINSTPWPLMAFGGLTEKGRESIHYLMQQHLKPEDMHEVDVWEEAIRMRQGDVVQPYIVFPSISTKHGSDVEIELDSDEFVISL